MKINKLKLFTNTFEPEKMFYTKTLGFETIESNSKFFTVKTGWSYLTFQKTEKEHQYHYCFLIPSNKLIQALEWMEKRISILDIDNGRKTQRFESWNADSFYFYDASGIIVEFIVRPDLDNASRTDFKISDVLCLNKIGMPTNDIEKTNNRLLKSFRTEFWKGDLSRFGTNGSQEGLFLLTDYKINKIWFPTASLKISPEPFQITIENHGKKYDMEFINGKIITCNNA